VKRWLKKVLSLSRIPRVVASVGPSRAVILRYHSVQPVPAEHANTIGVGIVHSEALFARQMELLARRFNPVTIDDIASWLQGEGALPRRAVAITFDDGFRDNYETAAPNLARYGLRAAFYITVGTIGSKRGPWFCRLRQAFYSTSAPHWIDPGTGQARRLCDPAGRREGFLSACRICATLTGDRQEAFLDGVDRELQVKPFSDGGPLMMNWDQVAALYRDGHVIGSHTMTHPNLAYSTRSEARYEMQRSKDLLERQLATSIRHFSYPAPILEPHCSDETTAMAARCGYVSAVTCIAGAVQPRHRQFVLPRVFAPLDADEFLWSVEASLAGRIV
jgi:peptidoglycan/xylan/chitin deacetylase (PgdA/CDA1 family)